VKAGIHVFAGPSLPRAARAGYEKFAFHGPAAQGDVYRLTASRPRAIAIVDGYFERTAAVWHNEILWALAQGIHVFGAASMGALRAAELAPFGMLGVGRIFEAFANGSLTDDDEVTIVHADETWDFRAGSEAMVNIRATLRAALDAGVVAAHEHDALVAAAKRTFYPDRSYPALLAAAERELSPSSAARVASWLGARENHVDQKRSDGLELLASLARERGRLAEPHCVPWTFRHTDAWEQVRATFARERRPKKARGARVDARAPRVALSSQRGAHPRNDLAQDVSTRRLDDFRT